MQINVSPFPTVDVPDRRGMVGGVVSAGQAGAVGAETGVRAAPQPPLQFRQLAATPVARPAVERRRSPRRGGERRRDAAGTMLDTRVSERRRQRRRADDPPAAVVDVKA